MKSAKLDQALRLLSPSVGKGVPKLPGKCCEVSEAELPRQKTVKPKNLMQLAKSIHQINTN
jgi:hypothetical protein